MPIPKIITRAELLNLLNAYDRYIQQANDDNRYSEGWRPVCVNEFYDMEFSSAVAYSVTISIAFKDGTYDTSTFTVYGREWEIGSELAEQAINSYRKISGRNDIEDYWLRNYVELEAEKEL